MSAFPFDFNHMEPPHLEDPYPLYARARREAPVFFHPLFQSWIITRYADVIGILRDPKRFSSVFLFRTPVNPTPEVQAVLAEIPPEVPLLVTEDPPGHARTRALVSKAFAPKRVTAMGPRIRAIANELIDQFIDAGQADLVRQYTAPLPLQALLEFVGLPAADADFIKQWSHDHILLSVPGIGPEQQLKSARTEVAFCRYVEEIIAERQRTPRDDVLSELINARIEGERPFDAIELITLVQDILFAGHETTTNLLSNTFYHLLQLDEFWRAVGADPALAANAVEEGLRYDSSVQGMFRTTTEEVEVGGVTIPAGARVMVFFGAANRDETTFLGPERFDLHRANANKHLSMGYGIHYCIGAPLARLEAQIAIELILQRVPDLRLAPDQTASYLPNMLNRGLQHLYVIWGASEG